MWVENLKPLQDVNNAIIKKSLSDEDQIQDNVMKIWSKDKAKSVTEKSLPTTHEKNNCKASN